MLTHQSHPYTRLGKLAAAPRLVAFCLGPSPDWDALLSGVAINAADPDLADEPEPEPEPVCPHCHGSLRALAEPPEPWRDAYWTDCWECC